MSDFHREITRRTQQFFDYLSRMNHRTHEVACGDCFMIFEERLDSGSSSRQLSVKRRVATQLVATAQGSSSEIPDYETCMSSGLGDREFRDDSSEDEPPPKRFVQFGFERKWFRVDMPNSTLFRPESEQILRDRTGFFFVRDRPQFDLNQDDDRGHDPFQKVYVYGDELTAAEDMAFVWFHVWKFPVDSPLFVSAAAFDGPHYWEHRVRIA